MMINKSSIAAISCYNKNVKKETNNNLKGRNEITLYPLFYLL